MAISLIESRGCITRGFFVPWFSLVEASRLPVLNPGRTEKEDRSVGQMQPIVRHGIVLPVAFFMGCGRQGR